MALVIPKWNAFDVENWQQLIAEGDNGDGGLNVVTTMIINYMPIIGVTKLTAENAIDAWCRIMLMEALFGSLIESPHRAGEKKNYFITKDDVLRHIGVKIEGRTLSFADFYDSVCANAEGIDTDRTAQYIANNNQTLLRIAGVC